MPIQKRNTSRKAMKVMCTNSCMILLFFATVIFALCASDIATSLHFWEGHPHPNENSFRAFLLTECAYSECEPQGGEIANAEFDGQYKRADEFGFFSSANE